MNSLLVSERTIVQQQIEITPRQRASLLDRLAMRVGLWLLIWGTRSPDVDRAANEQFVDRQARELHWLRMQQLHRPC